MKKPAEKWPATLPIDERVATAQARLPKIVDNLTTLIHLHESNRIIGFSEQLSSQIPRSYAGHAFRLFQRTMLKAEVMRLCTLWDAATTDRNSLPTIAALIENEAVLAEIKVRALAKRERPPSPDEVDDELQAWMKETSRRRRAADNTVPERDAALRNAVIDIREIEKSPELEAVRRFRHKNLAHSLDDSVMVGPDPPYKLGYERKLLEDTIPIVNDLYLGLCQEGFLSDTRERAQKYAKALWDGCRFEVLE